MNPEELEKQATVRPKNYFGPLYEYLDEGYGRVFATHRDADYIERSNWDTVIEYMNEHFGEDKNDTWTVDSASHFLVGWVDELLVKIRNDAGEYTPEFLYMVDIHEALENYPILDEDKASTFEWEENHPECDNVCYSDDPDCGCEREKA